MDVDNGPRGPAGGSGAPDAGATAAPVMMDGALASGFTVARSPSSRKGQNGKVLVVGGSYMYHGAPVLSSLAALRFGADLVYTAVPKINAPATRAVSPDLIVMPMADAKLTRGSASKLLGMVPVGLDSAAIGMGLAVHERGALLRLVRSLADMDVRMVLDASALVPEILDAVRGANCVLTPHAGEFEHVFGLRVPSDVQSRALVASQCASRHRVTILLKGPTDVITDGESTYLCDAGTSAMTVGGTGDVLAGLCAGALASSRDPLAAAAVAAYANGRAGEIAASRLGRHMIASDLLGTVPSALMELEAAERAGGEEKEGETGQDAG